jgi:intracellular sulfur oxidation DsrE/DsrF family protein
MIKHLLKFAPLFQEMPMFKLFAALKSVVLALLLVTSFQAWAADDVIKTMYHVSEGITQASRALNNIRNHLSVYPKAKIVVVTHGAGIDFLLQGATNQTNQPFAGAIADLANQGVEFRICNNTLKARDIDPRKVVMEATVVPSCVAEVARLQAREGFVYLRP